VDRGPRNCRCARWRADRAEPRGLALSVIHRGHEGAQQARGEPPSRTALPGQRTSEVCLRGGLHPDTCARGERRGGRYCSGAGRCTDRHVAWSRSHRSRHLDSAPGTSARGRAARDAPVRRPRGSGLAFALVSPMGRSPRRMASPLVDR
jgi:hypothetical protein